MCEGGWYVYSHRPIELDSNCYKKTQKNQTVFKFEFNY